MRATLRPANAPRRPPMRPLARARALPLSLDCEASGRLEPRPRRSLGVLRAKHSALAPSQCASAFPHSERNSTLARAHGAQGAVRARARGFRRLAREQSRPFQIRSGHASHPALPIAEASRPLQHLICLLCPCCCHATPCLETLSASSPSLICCRSIARRNCGLSRGRGVSVWPRLCYAEPQHPATNKVHARGHDDLDARRAGERGRREGEMIR
jgi:hypothetical protein